MILCVDSSGLGVRLCLTNSQGRDAAVVSAELKSELSRDMSRLYAMLQEQAGFSGTKGVELIIAGSGPGAFIGTRVALSFVNGLAAASGIPMRMLDSLAALRLSVDDPEAVAVRDARRGQYYLNDAEGSRLLDTEGLRALVSTASHIVSDAIPVLLQEDRSLIRLQDELALCPGRLSWLTHPGSAAMLAAASADQVEFVEPVYLRGFL
jgi:tRNA A37 threonylcarbamoyladenosine modification protein TsaB